MYTPRLTAPESGNKYYNTVAMGGYSSCIIGNANPYTASGNAPATRKGWVGLNTLPNCVSYANGRFNEIGGYGKIKYNLNSDAKNLVTVAKRLGLKTGTTPKLGALLVWSNSKYGHVAVVEKIESDTSITVSQSGWSYTKGPMWIAKHEKGDGNWLNGTDYSWMRGKYTFAGFVYNPAVSDDDIITINETSVYYLGGIYKVKAATKDGQNYIRLKDYEDVLHLCGVGYFNRKVTINGKAVDLKTLSVIEYAGENYIRLRDMDEVLGLCKVSYDQTRKLPVIEV